MLKLHLKRRAAVRAVHIVAHELGDILDDVGHLFVMLRQRDAAHRLKRVIKKMRVDLLLQHLKLRLFLHQLRRIDLLDQLFNAACHVVEGLAEVAELVSTFTA